MKKDSEWAHTQRRLNYKLALWTGAWVGSMALATFGSEFLWNGISELTLGVIILNVLLGIGMIIANRQYLMGLDEMQRKIQLETMAVTLGLAVVLGLGYSMMDITDLILFDAEISHLVILIGLSYLIGTLIGNYRYK